jgi:hypothetical protein
MTHDLKIWPKFFKQVAFRLKSSEICLNDRDFQVGDKLNLREYNFDLDSYTGNSVIRTISCITTHAECLAIQEDYVLLSLL